MRLLIVEDEPLVRQRLLRLAQEIAGERARFDTAATVEQAEERLRRQAYDGVLLDLSLEGEDGFDVLRRAVAGAFHTVVVSAHADRALQAFELGVLDFVPKPFSRGRLGQALERLLDAGRHRTGAARYLGVWRPHGVGVIALADVAWLHADGEHSEVRLRDGRIELHDKPLSRLADVLPDDFVRCHRSYVVNLAHTASLQASTGSRYALTLRDGTVLPVGRSHVATLRERLAGG